MSTLLRGLLDVVDAPSVPRFVTGVMSELDPEAASEVLAPFVPLGAKTGVIAIESSLGSARSKAKFTVRR